MLFARSKNEIVDAEPLRPQYLGEEAGEDLPPLGGRPRYPPAATSVPDGAGVDCRRGQRQYVEDNRRHGDHVGRELLGQCGACCAGSAVPVTSAKAFCRGGPRGPSPPPDPPRSSRASAAWISPSSVRSPRILTCSSMRRILQLPSAPHRARSPVRFLRVPGAPAPPKGRGYDLEAVNPGQPHRQPPPRDRPHTTHRRSHRPAHDATTGPARTTPPRHRRADPAPAPDPAVSGALLEARIVVSVGPSTLTITRPRRPPDPPPRPGRPHRPPPRPPTPNPHGTASPPPRESESTRRPVR